MPCSPSSASAEALDIAAAAAALRAGATTSEALTAAALERIEDPSGQGRVAFVHVAREAALAAARASDALRRAGIVPSPLAGIPVSVKDLFDVAGQTTTAGSRVLADAASAQADAVAVARLRAAGAVVIGRTNMTEFAFSGLGLNPHHGTPLAAFDRATGRIAGGSSSGAAVSVAEGMAHAGLGTDTGGSLRIPAAFCGLAAFKPTAARVPADGAYPLSRTLDSVGPIARTVACCAAVDAVLAAEPPAALASPPVRFLRLAVADGPMLDDLDPAVARAFDRALARLAAAGACIERRRCAGVESAAESGVQGIVASAEAWAVHRALLQRRGTAYDPIVAWRIRGGAGVSGSDYVAALRMRAAIAADWAHASAPFDAWLAPTVACVPPALAPLERGVPVYLRADSRVLRNTALVNALDGCAASLPCHREGEPPAGLMLFAPAWRDRALLAVAQAVEAALA